MIQTLTQRFFRRIHSSPADTHSPAPSAGTPSTTFDHAEQLLQSLFVMAWMVEARDPYTGGHLWRVSQYSRLLAEATGLSGAETARITLAGFLHDLGKVAVPDAILRKPGRLSGDEYEVIKTHPEVGARLLANHPLAGLAQAAVLHHHERIDGAGYPGGLAGGEIPQDARIVGICDAFDAMTSSRPYRHGMAVDDALTIIRDNLGRQFDGGYGERFIGLSRDGGFAGIVGHSDHGIPLQECPVCGPTIVVRRDQRDGDAVYCRNCGNQATIERKADHLRVRPTGRQGSPSELQPEADFDIVDELVRASAACLAV